MTTNEITSAIRRKILEETSDLISDSTILLNTNLSYDDLKYRTYTKDQIKSATVILTNGEGDLPDDFGTLYGDGYRSLTDKTPFPEKGIADFDRDSDGIEGMTVEEGKLRVNPSSTPEILIKYYPSYDALSTSQNPELNSYLHELIVYGALWRIHEDLQDEALSKYYRDLYEAELIKKTAAISGYEETNQRGNEMFNYQKLI